jgi:hypothetical protein
MQNRGRSPDHKRFESPSIELAKIQPKGASRRVELGFQKPKTWGSFGNSESSSHEEKQSKKADRRKFVPPVTLRDRKEVSTLTTK